MSKILEDMRRQSYQEGIKAVALRMLESQKLSLDEVKKLSETKTA